LAPLLHPPGHKNVHVHVATVTIRNLKIILPHPRQIIIRLNTFLPKQRRNLTSPPHPAVERERESSGTIDARFGYVGNTGWISVIFCPSSP
jgi:hypothetical protein